MKEKRIFRLQQCVYYIYLLLRQKTQQCYDINIIVDQFYSNYIYLKIA